MPTPALRASGAARPIAAILCLSVAAALAGCERPTAGAEPEPIVVYSARAEQLIRPLFERYTEETGIPIEFATDAEQPLIQRLRAEGEATPADLLMTVDAGNLWFAANEDVLRSLESETLEAAVPAHLRDPESRWFGLSLRARTIVYHTGRVDPSELTGYAGLADSKWQGRLCLRTSKKVYNQSLVAMLIADLGESETEAIVRGWVANLATDVAANDTRVMEAILEGLCDVGIVNSYYFGRLERERGMDLPLRLHWPAAEHGGVHVNVSGAGVTRYADQPEAALALLEWLAEGEAQALYASLNLEYPVNPAVEADPQVAAWGAFEASTMNVADAGRLQAAAVRLMDRAGYR